MDIRERRGLELAVAGFAAPNSSRSQTFTIIRPDWMLKVAFETASPWIQVDNLQIVRISDGSLDFNAYFDYKIENAGVKHLKVQLPEGAEVPEFEGRNILNRIDTGDGIWDIELTKKENTAYSLHIKFRIPYRNMKELEIIPVKALNVELQKGYLAVLSDDSIQVKAGKVTGELSPFDARKIAGYPQVKDLSNAVLCYRSVGTDYAVNVLLNRHKAAALLRAEIKDVHIDSIVSEEGNILSRMTVSLDNIGNENLFTVKLPPKSRLWSVYIDRLPEQENPGRAVEAAEENGKILIPVKQKTETQIIEIVYSMPALPEWNLFSQTYSGPEFELPLKNITWTFYLPEKYSYNDFSGTLEYKYNQLIPVPLVDVSEYDETNSRRQQAKKSIAKQWLSKANLKVKQGDMQGANDAFRNANSFALDDTELQEDVQGQWQNAQRDNVTELFRERAPQRVGSIVTLKNNNKSLSIPQRAMSRQEKATVNSISDRCFRQQQADGTEIQPLTFNIPTEGEIVDFTRALQNNRNEPMKVSFDAEPALQWKKYNPVYAGAILTIIFSLLFKMISVTRKSATQKTVQSGNNVN